MLGTIIVCVHNYIQCVYRREALRLWKNKNGSIATYDRLLRIFVNAGRNDCADILCKLLGAGVYSVYITVHCLNIHSSLVQLIRTSI